MMQPKLSLGQAIDQIVSALESLESDVRRTAIEAACSHLKIQPPSPAPSIGAVREGAEQKGNSNHHDRGPAHPPTASTDIRSLRAAKSPKSAREMACVVAFYLQELAPETERKDSVSTSDLEKYFKQANFKLPEKIAQVLPDAKGAGYFESAARGAYKLNAVGYNLVAHKLPAISPGA